jgi:hypothetical protein
MTHGGDLQGSADTKDADSSKLRPKVDPMPALIFEGYPYKLAATTDPSFVE